MLKSQQVIREGMAVNAVSCKSNTGPLPKIAVNIENIIEGHTFQNVSWLGDNEKIVQIKMWGIFTSFCKKYKKYSKSELSQKEIRDVYEVFALNYASLLLYLNVNKAGKQGAASRISQIWDSEFIAQYFGNDKFLAKELNMSEAQIREYFPSNIRLYFMLKDIHNPLLGLKMWMKGEIITPFGLYEEISKKLKIESTTEEQRGIIKDSY